MQVRVRLGSGLSRLAARRRRTRARRRRDRRRRARVPGRRPARAGRTSAHRPAVVSAPTPSATARCTRARSSALVTPCLGGSADPTPRSSRMATVPTRTTTRARAVFVETSPTGSRARRGHGRAGGRRRPHRGEDATGLLGADDHTVDPRRPRGLHAGRCRRRRGRRRDHDAHPRHRGDLDGDELGNDLRMGGALRRADPYCAAYARAGRRSRRPGSRASGPSVRCANCSTTGPQPPAPRHVDRPRAPSPPRPRPGRAPTTIPGRGAPRRRPRPTLTAPRAPHPSPHTPPRRRPSNLTSQQYPRAHAPAPHPSACPLRISRTHTTAAGPAPEPTNNQRHVPAHPWLVLLSRSSSPPHGCGCSRSSRSPPVWLIVSIC